MKHQFFLVRRMLRVTLPALLAAGAAQARQAPPPSPQQQAPQAPQAPQPQTCPREMPAQTRCYGGQDARGAFYVTAIPKAWNGVLVVHSHGGPRLKTPTAATPSSRPRALRGGGGRRLCLDQFQLSPRRLRRARRSRGHRQRARAVLA
jgi:glucose/arabinose dehydrogenase